MENSKRFTQRLISIFIVIISLYACQQNEYKMPHWLLGKWKTNYDGFLITEYWYKNKTGFTAVTVWHDKKSKDYEHINLLLNKDQLTYRIKTKTKNMDFVCDDIHNDTLIFVNNDNDFPKRIIYVEPTGDEMEVWIENFPNDPNEMRFPFKKIN
ncbi:MAG: hypothetical protein IT221_07960 [Fluviicola sp.]|nr:hypothetical protein [Fluviicola sp.]